MRVINLQVRISHLEAYMLNQICEYYEMERAEAVRYLIRKEADKIDHKGD